MPISRDEAQRVLLRIADRATPEIVRAFLKSVSRAKDDLSIRKLEAAVARRDFEAVLREVSWDRIAEQELQPEIARILRDTFEAAAEATVLPARVGIGLSLDVLNPRILTFVREETGRLIQGVSIQQRDAIRGTMQRMFEQGRGTRDAAAEIRDVIGLNARQAVALDTYARGLDEGLSQARRATLVDRYRNKLLRDRADMIARTESIKAATAGTQLQWADAVDKGLLDPGEWEQSWLTALDELVCPVCSVLNGTTAPIGGLFGIGLAGPPAHPRCRCALLLQLKSQRRAA